jgi:2'-5' RNA ligase
MVRCFVAVELSEEQRDSVSAVVEELKKSEAPVNWVGPGNLHATLRFFGDVGEKDLDKVKRACDDAVSRMQPFAFSLKGVGVFPNWNFVKVVWVGIERGAQELGALSEELKKLNVGFKDKKPFSPHVTVGRVKFAKNKEALVDALKTFEGHDFGETVVDRIKLKKSELTPKGPIYSDLYEAVIR